MHLHHPHPYRYWAQTRLPMHLHHRCPPLSIEDRREAVKELAAEGMSQRAIGEVLGVHHSTVAEDLAIGGNPPFNEAEASEDAGHESEAGGNPPLSAVATLAADEKLRKAVKVAEKRSARAASMRSVLRCVSQRSGA
jgi:IS30 family transposase